MIQKKCMVLLLLVLLLMVGCSEGTQESEEPGYEGDSQGLLYEGTIEGSKIHIYGGTTPLTEDHYPLAEGVMEAFDQAEVYAETYYHRLYTEAERQESDEMVAVYTPGEGSMDEDLSEEVFKEMSDIAVQNGVSPQWLSRYKPWAGRNFILSMSYKNGPLNYPHGTSDFFSLQVEESDMEIRSLYTLEETAELHNEIYNQIPLESQEQMIKETLEEIKAGYPKEKELVHAWKQGDIEALNAILEARLNHEDSGVRDYYQRSKNQNQETAKRIEQLVMEENNESYFFHISVLNTLGEKSLIEELGNLGFEFRPVEL